MIFHFKIYFLIEKLTLKRPQRCAHAALEELQRAFISKAGEKAATAKDNGLDRACGSLLVKVRI